MKKLVNRERETEVVYLSGGSGRRRSLNNKTRREK